MKNVKWFVGLILAVAIVWGVRQWYFQPKFIQGERAPLFEASLIDGSPFALEDLRGKYVLLDFWGSWCLPCRRENPELVVLWEKYNRKKFRDGEGFEIVSIGLESKENSWKNAIQKDGLRWRYHISDLQRMKSEIALLYGVKEIPTKYLINPEGYIVGVNQSVAGIDLVLQERLK